MKFFGGDGREVVEGFVGALVVEPGDPVEGLELDVLDAAPGAFGADELCLEQADLGLGQGVVVGVSDGAD